MEIRKSTDRDADAIMDIFVSAKRYMKENGIDYTNDDSVHPAIMLYSEAGRIYSRLLRTRKIEDLLRMEGEYNLMNGMVNEMKAGAWANLSGEDVSRKVM